MRFLRFLILVAIGLCSLAWSADTPAPGFSVVVLENDVARVELTTQRGSIQRFMLKEHHPLNLPKCWHTPGREYPGKNEVKKQSLDVLGPFQTGSGKHNWLRSDGNSLPDIMTVWDITSQSATRVVFRAHNPTQGLTYQLGYQLTEKAAVQCELRVSNRGSTHVGPVLSLVPINGVHQDIGRNENAYLALAIHRRGVDGIESLTYPLAPKTVLNIDRMESVDAVTVKSRFFGAIWRPDSIQVLNPSTATVASLVAPEAGPGGLFAPKANNTSVWETKVSHFWGNLERDPSIAFDPMNPGKNIKAPEACRDPQHQVAIESIISGMKEDGTPRTMLAPGGSMVASWEIAVTGLTKREIALLPAHEQPFEYTSWMHRSLRLLSNALTAILNGLGTYTGFGVAVILVTLMVKLVLHRLNVKQQRSMIKMQQLSPELARLKAQCGADRQQFAMKQMELWKKHGVNPLAGCLPILIQLPIFFALFNTFSYSADMRGHHFLWLRDLTLPDQTFYLGFDLPNLITGIWPIGGGPATLNILPLLYLGASLAMTFTQPQPTNLDPDSQQAQMMKIMKWMPILFVCFFYDMPSGLVLYFTAQAILSAVESVYIRKQMAKLK